MVVERRKREEAADEGRRDEGGREEQGDVRSLLSEVECRTKLAAQTGLLLDRHPHT